MPFDWKQLTELARNLVRQADSGSPMPEALRRSAVGRLYYSVFGYARSYASNYLKYTIRGDESDHGALRAHLKGKRRHADADRLDRLRQWRNEADYLDDLPWDDGAVVVAEAIKAAEKLFASLVPPATSSAR